MSDGVRLNFEERILYNATTTAKNAHDLEATKCRSPNDRTHSMHSVLNLVGLEDATGERQSFK